MALLPGATFFIQRFSQALFIYEYTQPLMCCGLTGG